MSLRPGCFQLLLGFTWKADLMQPGGGAGDSALGVGVPAAAKCPGADSQVGGLEGWPA